MSGDLRLWQILNDKLEMLRAGNRLPEAIRVAEKADELAQRAFPPNDPHRALSLEKLGHLHHQVGDNSSARPYLEKAHKAFEKSEPPDSLSTYRSARRLALLFDHLADYEKALHYSEQAIDLARELPDLPCSEIGTLLSNVALIYRKTGRTAAAEPCYLSALEIYENQLGPEHVDVASVLNNLGVFYTNERRFAEAEKIHRRALAIREKIHQKAHPDIAQSKCNLAVVYHSNGDYARASDLYRASMLDWEAAGGDLPEDYETVASNYADLMRSLGKGRQAHQIEERAQKKRRG